MFVALLVCGGAYLIGSIPFSFLVARAFGVRDVRKVGSGNVGATNVLRSAGRTAGAVALALDVAKGAFAVALAARLAPEPVWPALAAFLVVVGHVFPVWLGLHGGKGVATGLGAFAWLEPTAALLALPVFLLTVVTTHFASLGSVLGALSLAAFAFVFRGRDAVAIAAAATAALILLRHRSNLRRILDGTERRLGAESGARP
jgi:glycerol-3-phosphate acyltransferase PlsY